MKITGYATLDINLFVGDGQTDNTDLFQAVIDRDEAISLPPGVFLIRPLTMKAGTQITGVGSGTYATPTNPSNQTILKPVPGINADLLVGSPDAANVKLSGFQVDMTGNTSGKAINLQDGAWSESQWHIDRLYLHHLPDVGIYIGSGRYAAHLSEVIINIGAEQGIVIKSSDCILDKCNVGMMIKEGIVVLDSITRITSCDIFMNQCGIALQWGWGNIVSGCGIDRSKGQGIWIDPGAYGISLMGNVFHSNSQAAEGGYAHIDVGGAKQVVAMGNVFGPSAQDMPNKASYCIYMRPNSSVTGMDTNVMHEGAALHGFTNLPPEEW